MSRIRHKKNWRQEETLYFKVQTLCNCRNGLLEHHSSTLPCSTSSNPCQPQPPISISPVDFPGFSFPQSPLFHSFPHVWYWDAHTVKSLFHHLPRCVFPCLLLRDWIAVPLDKAGMPQTSWKDLILMTNEEKRQHGTADIYTQSYKYSAKTRPHSHTSTCMQAGNRFLAWFWACKSGLHLLH